MRRFISRNRWKRIQSTEIDRNKWKLIEISRNRLNTTLFPHISTYFNLFPHFESISIKNLCFQKLR